MQAKQELLKTHTDTLMDGLLLSLLLKSPEIVVTVFLENAGFATNSAAPIARLLHEYYLRGTYNNNVYNYVKNWEPRDDNSNQTAE